MGMKSKMLKEVKEIGEFAIDHKNLEPLNIIVDQPLNKRVIEEGNAKVICIDFNLENGKLDYAGVHIEDYDTSKLTKYLYRDHPSHRFRITPTDKISTLEKTSWRVAYWFRKFDKYLSNDFIKNLKEKLTEEKEIEENILSDVKQKFKSFESDSKKNSLLTITFQTDGGQKHIGDLEIFNSILKEEGMSEFWVPDVPLEEGVCYLCGEEKEVSRPREPFSFYTVNPKGFAQSLNVVDSWKQLPICSECTLTLVAGRNFMDEHLSKRFYGYRFYVIPKFLFGGIEKEIMEDIINLKEKDYQGSLLTEEDDILYYMRNNEGVVNLIFVFYEVKQGGKNFDILKYIEDVPPSWIKEIIDVFKNTTSKEIFEEDNLQIIFGDKWVGSFKGGTYKGNNPGYMSFGGMLRTFFPDSENTGNHDKEFLDVIGNILSKQKFQENVLIEAFVRELRYSHVKEEWNERLLALKSLYVLDMIKSLELLRGDGCMNKKSEIKKKINKNENRIENFFDDFSKAFDTNAKKAVFLEGVLTKFLLDIQSRERNSTPFRSKLRGLRLDESKIKNLFPEITEKLRQYEAPYYSWLEEMISQYFIAADNDGWGINKNEISYYFALGLNLGRVFKRKEKKEKDVEGEKNE